MKYLILFLTGITSSLCYALPDDIEKLVEKKVKDERNWVDNYYDFREKNFSEYYTSENLNLDLDLFKARMDASLQKTRVMVDKAIAEKSKDPKKRAEYKKIYAVSSEELKELEKIRDEKVCPAIKFSFSYYVFLKANQRFSNLSDIQNSRKKLEDQVSENNYLPCIKELAEL